MSDPDRLSHFLVLHDERRFLEALERDHTYQSIVTTMTELYARCLIPDKIILGPEPDFSMRWEPPEAEATYRELEKLRDAHMKHIYDELFPWPSSVCSP